MGVVLFACENSNKNDYSDCKLSDFEHTNCAVLPIEDPSNMHVFLNCLNDIECIFRCVSHLHRADSEQNLLLAGEELDELDCPSYF